MIRDPTDPFKTGSKIIKMAKKETRILLGNVAVARGVVEAGCHVVTSYPGTPSSEIIPAVVEYKKELGLDTYIECQPMKRLPLIMLWQPA
jgi:TPP-dependent indolepyruvate ferredoxin oxidoreductase alpha subunit